MGVLTVTKKLNFKFQLVYCRARARAAHIDAERHRAAAEHVESRGMSLNTDLCSATLKHRLIDS